MKFLFGPGSYAVYKHILLLLSVVAVFDELLCAPVASTAKVLHEKNDAVLDLMDAPTSIGDRVRHYIDEGFIRIFTFDRFSNTFTKKKDNL